MAVHDKSIPQCPMIVACGPPQTGKTTAIKIGMLMIGIEMLHKDRSCHKLLDWDKRVAMKIAANLSCARGRLAAHCPFLLMIHHLQPILTRPLCISITKARVANPKEDPRYWYQCLLY